MSFTINLKISLLKKVNFIRKTFSLIVEIISYSGVHRIRIFLYQRISVIMSKSGTKSKNKNKNKEDLTLDVSFREAFREFDKDGNGIM